MHHALFSGVRPPSTLPARPAAGLAVLLLLVLLAGTGCSRPDARSPEAANGVLNLSQWDAARDGPLELKGPWEFYWNELLSPDSFQSGSTPPQRTGLLAFPGFWKDLQLNGRALPPRGYATFHLRIVPGPGERRWEIRVFSIGSAYRLWADGKLVLGVGKVGTSPANTSPERTIAFGDITSHGNPLDLVLQISNYHFRRGGVHYPILLSAPGELHQAHMRTWCWAMLFCGGLLSIAIYHFVLYFLRKKDPSPLYVGGYALVLMVMYATMDASEWLALYFFPHADSMIVGNIGLTCYVFSNSLLYRFYRSLFPDVFIVQLQYFCDFKSLAFLPFVFFAPYYTIYVVFPYFVPPSLIVVTCATIQLGICVKRGYVSSLILLVGCFFLAATAYGEIFFHLVGTSPETIFPMATVALILSQAFALALRFSNAFSTVESLSRTMDAKNIALRAEMDERNRLEREIVRVSEEERRRISHDLHDGICQSLGGIRLRCGVLEMSPRRIR